MPGEIPEIDVGSLVDGTNISDVAKQIHKACLEYGFFRIVNSGISEDLQTEVMHVTSKFFTLPVEIKRRLEPARGKFRGYVKFGGEITDGKADWREGLYYLPEFQRSNPAGRAEAVFSGVNPWPDQDLPEFRRAVAKYLQQATAIGFHLMSAIATELGQEADFFTKKYTNEPFTQIGLFHYPPHESSDCKDEEVFGVGEHTDYGNLTILLQDEVGGLQIQAKDGNWIDVPSVPGSLVVNIGDMLEGWTGGAYRATRHRVKTSRRHRLSVALFFDPSLECVISPIPFENTSIPTCLHEPPAPKIDFPVVYGDYVLEKYVKSL